MHTDEVLTQAPLWDYSKNFLFTYLDRHRDDGYAWAIFDHRYYEVSNALFGLIVMAFMMVLLFNVDRIKQYFDEPFRITSAITMFSISFLMMTPVSIFVWIMIKPMQTIQFPWRFTSFVLPFGTIIVVYALDLIGKLMKEKVSIGGYKFLFYCLALVFSLLVYVDVVNMYRWKWVPEQSLLKAAIYVLWGNEEYRPNITGDPNWKQINFKSDFSPSIASSNPAADIAPIKWLSHERIFQVFSPEQHQIRLRTFYFPGWNVYVDGNKVDLSMDPKYGSIVVQVPAGKHKLVAKFELTPLRKSSAYVSLAALLIYAVMLLNLFKEKNLKSENKTKNSDEEKESINENKTVEAGVN